MKQVKCWVEMSQQGVALDACSCNERPGPAWIEMIGTLPEPGRWVRGEPEHAGSYWRWSNQDRAERLEWNGAYWCGALSVRYRPHYWDGSNKPTEGPAAEGSPMKSVSNCDVRWTPSSCLWRVVYEGHIQIGTTELSVALKYAEQRGWRVTNDPREVVLQQRDGGWIIADGSARVPTTLEFATAECRRRGWRILREEAAEPCPHCGSALEPPDGGKSYTSKGRLCRKCGRHWFDDPEQRPTLGEMANALASEVKRLNDDIDQPRIGSALLAVEALCVRIVEAIGRDRR